MPRRPPRQHRKNHGEWMYGLPCIRLLTGPNNAFTTPRFWFWFSLC